MSRYQRTPTTIMVTPLDLSEAAEEARAWVNRHREIDGKPLVLTMHGDKLAIVETPGGIYALCTEGVGPEHAVTDDKPLGIDFWVDKTEGDGDKQFLAMAPCCEARATPEELRKWATGEPVNLADWVRTFGARLDGNYESWRRLLENATRAEAV